MQTPELGAGVGAGGWVRCHGRVPSVGLLPQQPDLLLWRPGGRAHGSPCTGGSVVNVAMPGARRTGFDSFPFFKSINPCFSEP